MNLCLRNHISGNTVPCFSPLLIGQGVFFPCYFLGFHLDSLSNMSWSQGDPGRLITMQAKGIRNQCIINLKPTDSMKKSLTASTNMIASQWGILTPLFTIFCWVYYYYSFLITQQFVNYVMPCFLLSSY